MRKIIFAAAFAFLLILPYVSALNLEISKADRGSVVISQLNNPAIFDFTVNNKGGEENIEIYSLLAVAMTPTGAFDLPSGESVFTVKAYPSKEIRRFYGFYDFEYVIKGRGPDVFKDFLRIKIIPLEEAVIVGADNFKPGDSTANVFIRNTANTNLEDLEIEFSSAFFDVSTKASLKPYEQKNITVNLDSSKIKGINAGAYIMDVEISSGEAKASVKGTINYLEREGLSVNEDSSGFIIREKKITKTNVGNVPVNAKIEVTRDIVSRLFTVYSLEPQSSERKGIGVAYSWEKELRPGESFEVGYTTNYTFPFVLLILIIVVVFAARAYYMTHVTLTKRVSFVRTKGGEFALKVNLSIKARKGVANVQIIDRLPGSTQLYEKFGVRPDKIDPATRRLIWVIPKLNAGEERVFSYILYSKLKIVGRFELPSATAIFEREDKTHEVFSNKTYFVSETIQRLED